MIYYCMNYVLWLIDRVFSGTITCFCFEPKNEKAKRWKYIVGIFLIQLPILTLKYVFSWNPAIRTLGWVLTVATSIIYLLVFFQGYAWQKVLFVIFEVICCVFSERIAQIFFYDALMQLEEVNYKQPIVVFYIAVIEMLFAITFLFFMLLWKKLVMKKGYNLKIFFVFCIFPISQMIMFLNTNLEIFDELSAASISAMLSLLLGILADVILMVLLLRQQSMHEMEMQLKEVEKAWEVEQNHYRDIEARREELAKIRHDLSEQFIVMQELLHQENYEKVKEMLQTLREYVASTKEYVYCADPVVNAIMAENERECQKKGVRLTYNLEIMQPLKINPVVLCSIFSNLMRNALTAATYVEDKSKACIDIKAAIKGDYLVVKVNNTYSEVKKKEKKKRKGYGLDILKTVVDKYNGQMDVIAKDGNYSTSLSVENIEIIEK